MLNDEYSNMAANAICHAVEMMTEAVQQATAGYGTPSAIWRPELFQDGDKWCALYGDGRGVGVAGFGDTPALAMDAFDKAWHTEAPPIHGQRGPSAKAEFKAVLEGPK